jgi:subtilisin
MVDARPAYSAQFASDVLPMVPAVPYLDDISPEWAWEGSTGAGIKVAVIDSGVDAGHPDVGYVNGYCEVGDDDGTPVFSTLPHDDAYGHGTACAGVIRNIAPDCEIYSVKVLGSTLTGRGMVFAAGLRWAIENGMHVCNLSLGTTKKDFYGLFHELADHAYFRNVMLVTAANNMPIPSFPSVYASVISVASHEIPDPYRFYYNPNPPVEFGAPGIEVRVPWLNGGYLTATGNSFAAPHITGIVTRIMSKHPGLASFHVKAVLRGLAANVAPAEAPTAVATGPVSGR